MTDPAAASQPSAAGPLTLTLDIGGTGLKAGLLDAHGGMIGARVRVRTPQPATPDAVVPALVGMAGQLGGFDRIAIGFPGVVSRGTVRTAPNLGTKVWAGFDLGGALQGRLGRPVRMLNDAQVQGLGVIAGRGLECVITLGTGLGFALYQDGGLAPHLEMGQHVARKDMTYDEYVGIAALEKVGRKRWNRRVERAVGSLRTLINFDALHVGGGNAHLLDFALPADVRIVSNAAGITGGARLWDPRLDSVFAAPAVPA